MIFLFFPYGSWSKQTWSQDRLIQLIKLESCGLQASYCARTSWGKVSELKRLHESPPHRTFRDHRSTIFATSGWAATFRGRSPSSRLGRGIPFELCLWRNFLTRLLPMCLHVTPATVMFLLATCAWVIIAQLGALTTLTTFKTSCVFMLKRNGYLRSADCKLLGAHLHSAAVKHNLFRFTKIFFATQFPNQDSPCSNTCAPLPTTSS